MRKFYANVLTFRTTASEGLGIHRPVYDAAQVEAELDSLRTQLAEAKAVLRMVGLRRRAEGYECLVCHRLRGHAPDCRLAKILEAK